MTRSIMRKMALRALILLSAAGASGCGGGSSGAGVQQDACGNYPGVQGLAEITAKGFIVAGEGHCRLARNHDALALSGVDVTLMSGQAGAGVPIAVIDSGFRVTHESIDSRIMTVAGYHDVDADYALDAGEKTLDDAAPLIAAHGTGVAALSAGSGVGVAPGAVLWLKSMGDENPLTVDLAISTIDAITNEGIGIINHSNDLFSGGLIYRNVGNDFTGILPALAAGEAVVVAAAGNYGDDLSDVLDGAQHADATVKSFLDSSNEASHVLFVGAWDAAAGALDVFSNHPGHRANVQARFLVTAGDALDSASSGGDAEYRSVTGTSFAAPLVSGALAVLQEVNPRLTTVEAADILLETARRPSRLGYGSACASTTALGTFSADCGAMLYGRGIMDLPAAVERAKAI